MTNKEISHQFKLLASLMELHQESPFKIRTYQNAVRTIEKFARPFKDMTPQEMLEIPGIGSAVGQKTSELLTTGHIKVLDQFIEKTPSGIIEMLGVKGLGPKKIEIIWRELGIENLGELLYACEENRLMLLKGFGQKTQDNIKAAILFFQDQKGQFLYAQVESLAHELDQMLKTASTENGQPANRIQMAGQFIRQLPVIEKLEWVTTLNETELRAVFTNPDVKKLYPAAAFIRTEDPGNPSLAWLEIHSDKLPDLSFTLMSTEQSKGVTCGEDSPIEHRMNQQAFLQNGSPAFIEAVLRKYAKPSFSDWYTQNGTFTPADLFKKLGIHFIPVPQREFPQILEKASKEILPPPIQTSDIKGIIHCHSRYSDGGQTLKEMALAAKEKGFEYLMISDHSKSAGYAGGLQPDRIVEQHAEIDQLNEQLAPFKIFKSIESDILRHGDLDYPPEILQSFDLVIASVHSVLKMDQNDATARLIKAIEHPFTHILGHMTGRLLLSRQGYPLDMEKILDACKQNNVVIELNANPRRLDIDWRHIGQALDRGIRISIDPDAHSIAGLDDIRYGVLVAQKAGVTPAQNLSSFSLQQMEQYISKNKIK